MHNDDCKWFEESSAILWDQFLFLISGSQSEQLP